MDRGRNPNCLLGYWPDEQPDKCNPIICLTCGWRPEVEKARKEELEKKYAIKQKRRNADDQGTTAKVPSN